MAALHQGTPGWTFLFFHAFSSSSDGYYYYKDSVND